MTGVGDHEQGYLNLGHECARDLSAGQVGNAPLLMFAQWFTDTYQGGAFTTTVPWNIDGQRGQITISVSSVATDQPAEVASQIDARFLMCALSKAASVARDNQGEVPEKVRISVQEYSKATAQRRSSFMGRDLVGAIERLRNSRIVTDIRDEKTGAETRFSWISEATINYRYRYVPDKTAPEGKRREQMITSFDVTLPAFLRRLVHVDLDRPLRPYQVEYFQMKSPTIMRFYEVANSGPDGFKISLEELYARTGGSNSLRYFKRNVQRAFKRHFAAKKGTTEGATETFETFLPGFSVYLYGSDCERSLHWIDNKLPKDEVWFYFERSDVQLLQLDRSLDGVPEYVPQLTDYDKKLIISSSRPDLREASMS